VGGLFFVLPAGGGFIFDVEADAGEVCGVGFCGLGRDEEGPVVSGRSLLIGVQRFGRCWFLLSLLVVAHSAGVEADV